jgi:hypothetical protein
MADVPTVKRKSGQSLKRQERQIVVNVFNYIKTKNPDKSASWLAAETATATGTSKNMVLNIRSEAARGPLRTPNKKRRSRGARSNSRKVKYNAFVRSGIRIEVHEFYFKNQPPTLYSLLAAVNNDLYLPDFKRTTLLVLLKEVGFIYEKR